MVSVLDSRLSNPGLSKNGYQQIYCWGVTCDGLASLPGEQQYFYPLNATETGVKYWEPWASWAIKALLGAKGVQYKRWQIVQSQGLCFLLFVFDP